MQTLQPIQGTSLTKQATRVQGVDVLRGAVMVLMAIDHVRCYSGQPAGGPTAGIFFTRWVTHFCAPAFVFFAGTSAFLYYNKVKDKGLLARFLLVRGLLLVALELTVIKFFWGFNLNYANFTLAGVIWMLGWCMVLLAAFVRLKPLTITIIGLVIIFAQQAFHYVPQLFPQAWQQYVGWVWGFFYPSGLDNMPHIAVLFVILPWLGVMMAGFGFGQLLLRDAAFVKKFCLWVGLSATAAWLIVGSIILLTQQNTQPTNAPFIFRLLAQQKYPPSQVFLLMTLGPLIAFMPLAQRAKGPLAGGLKRIGLSPILFGLLSYVPLPHVLKTIGRVPMFYYLLHILLIHVSALIVNLFLSGNMHQEWYNTAPFTNVADGEKWSLGMLYLVYAVDLVILYFACSWYAKYKFAHPEKNWLKFI